ncbi:MAG: hypothetical protein IKP74_02970 [Clostridia bacterium]|nr:hypothetical protein [Clostridia bacterium]
MGCFPDFVGSDALTARIGDAVRRGRLSHAYLIEGPEGSGKRTFATMIAAAVSCERRGDEKSDLPCGECPACKKILSLRSTDVHYLDRGDRASVPVEAVRDLRREMSLSPTELDTRFFIIDDADLMTPAAQNALLISLEEPPAGVLILLLATSSDGLLPTVRSRVQTLRLEPVSPDLVTAYLLRVSPEAKKLKAEGGGKLEAVIAAAHGRIGVALEYLTPKREAALLKTRETVAGVIRAAVSGSSYAEICRAVFSLPTKRAELSSHLVPLTEAIRDLVVLKRAPESPLLFYVDRDEAKALSDKADYPRLVRVYDACRDATDAVQANGNVQTVLTSFAVAVSR